MKNLSSQQPSSPSAMRPLVSGVALLLIVSLYMVPFAAGQERIPDATPHPDQPVILEGVVSDEDYDENISGLAATDQFLVIGADEDAKVQVLTRQNPETFHYKGQPDNTIPLQTLKKGDEVDIEGIAQGAQFFYVIGSHSRKRLRVKNQDGDKETVQENLHRLAQTAIEPSREQLFRLQLEADGQLVEDSLKSMSLRDFILNHPVLAPFQVIASKENGIDIEGIAAQGDTQLYIGFRGPKLRGNFVPVMVLSPKPDKEDKFIQQFKEKFVEAEVRFVHLDGRGIRDMVAVENGFLILGGPVGDESIPYQLFFWDGHNTVPGKDERDAGRHVKALCTLSVPKNDQGQSAKAEGLTLLQQDRDRYRFMVVYDGAKNGGGAIFSCST